MVRAAGPNKSRPCRVDDSRQSLFHGRLKGTETEPTNDTGDCGAIRDMDLRRRRLV
ncbi:hypothetical protein MESS4_430205 [Mesorhizobium sp. STM 4661]|nr:hypothetical protein MESS4_430205 [Mesorhizobium sp. STM 4661]